MKKGIRRIEPALVRPPVESAKLALSFLRVSLAHAKLAGSCYTAARIRAAISSAKGAVRAAVYRTHRATVRNILDMQAEAENFERGKRARRP